ncbi:MAG: hypothetical protein ACFFAS_07645 [Promethearchaeota archaeon]
MVDELVSIRKASNLHAPLVLGAHIEEDEGRSKYGKHIEIFSRTCDLINSKIRTDDVNEFKNGLLDLFKDASFIQAIKDIASETFGPKTVDKRAELVRKKFGIDSLDRWITPNGRQFIDPLLRIDENGHYKMELDETFGVYALTDTKLKDHAEVLDKVKFFVVSGKIKSSSELSGEEKSRILDGDLAVVHDESGKNGLILVDLPQITLPPEVFDGYQDPETGEVMEGVFVAKNGYLLTGLVSINYISGELVKIHPEELARILSMAVVEESFDGKISGIDINKYYTLNYERSSVQTAGRLVTYVIQGVLCRIVPTGAHQKLVSAYEVLRKTLIYEMHTQQQLREMYGANFLREFNDLFLNLFRLYSKNQYVVPKIHLYYDKLNGYFEGYDFDHFILGPTIDQVNHRVSELFRDADGNFDLHGFLEFIWKNEDGSFKSTYIDWEGNIQEFTTKMWLANIYNYIENYNGDDTTLLQAKASLIAIAGTDDYANDFDLIESKSFTKEEANLAKVVFDEALTIFGHFTVRLAFANMINYYYMSDAIGIKVVQRPSFLKHFLNNFRHISFITHSSGHDQAFRSHQQGGKAGNIFGFFFLDSSLRLDLTDGSNIDLDMPFGPLVGINAEGILRITGTKRVSSERKFSQNIAQLFAENLAIVDIRKDPVDAFIKSQENLFEFLLYETKVTLESLFQNKRIVEAVEERGISVAAEKKSLLQKISRKLMNGVFHYESSKNFIPRGSIRAFIDHVLAGKDEYKAMSYNYYLTLPYEGIPHPDPAISQDFYIEISQEKLIDIEFQHWGNTKDIWGKMGSFSNVKQIMIEQQTYEIIQVLENIIKFDSSTNGKVRIVPLIELIDSRGNLLKDEHGNLFNLGYQFVDMRDYAYNSYFPRNGYIDIDLSNPYSKDILKHVIYLMMTFDCSFIMTRQDDTLYDIKDSTHSLTINDVLCVFNMEGFLDINELKSVPVSADASRLYSNYNVKLTKSSTFGVIWAFFKERFNLAWSNDFCLSLREFKDFYFAKIENQESFRSQFVMMQLESIENKFIN